MSKVYVLTQTIQGTFGDSEIIKGIVTDVLLAIEWSKISGVNNYALEIELYDIEFINRIKKESESNDKTT